MINSIKDGVFETGKRVKQAAKDAINNSDSEWLNTVRAFDEIVRKEKNTDRITIDFSDQFHTDSQTKMIPATCTQCGAPLKVDPNWETAVCPHCDTSFVVSKAINQYTVEHADIKANTVQVHKKGTVEAALSYYEKHREQKKEEERKEAEKRAELAAAKRAKRNAWFRRNGIKALFISSLTIMILTAVGIALLFTARNGKINTGISSAELLKNNYLYAEQKLRQAGFSNISLLPDPDLVFGFFNTDGQVKSVSIGSKTSFSSMSYFRPDESVIITYHTYPSKEKAESVSEITPTPSAVYNKESYTAIPTSMLTPEPVYTPEVTPAPSNKKPAVLTRENNEDLEALLSAEYVDADRQVEFVSKYKGKTIEFDCLVLNIQPTPNRNTMYDYVLVPGQDKDSIGAALFMAENMNFLTFHWDSATRPDYLEVGSKIRIQAEIKTGSDSTFIYLSPKKTWGR